MTDIVITLRAECWECGWEGISRESRWEAEEDGGGHHCTNESS